MKTCIFTIVLNGMPTLPTIFFTLQSTKLDWHWYIIEGAANNTHCTAWCRQQLPGLSEDGTSQFLKMIETHPRVTVIQREMWDGKVDMCNAALEQIKIPCILMQMDADELWRADILERFIDYFSEDGNANRAAIKCRYFLGVNIVSTKDGTYGNNHGEWLRAWKFSPGDKFDRHEPPQLIQSHKGHLMNPAWLKMDGIFFDHYAWAFENQVGYKEQFYGYPNALENWRKLQANTLWPIKSLKEFLPWVGEGAGADRLV